MKYRAIFAGIVLSMLFVFSKSAQQSDFPVLKGPYFGQKVPKGGAEVFLDGIISKLNEDEMCAAFTRDAKEFYYNAHHRGNWAIFMTKEVDGQWMRPAPLPMTSDYTDRDFTMSPDGNRIFFGSNRPRNEGEDPAGSLDIFVTERLPAGRWSEPKNIGPPVNTDRGENYPSCARNGNLYFFSSRENGFGGCDIYVSGWENGRYSAPENLGNAVNSDRHDWDAVIAPDESFIIFSSQDRVDSIGNQDLYISYRTDDGSWTTARNMGPAVNSPHDEICPSLSLDGRCLFFTSRRRGKADIFWVDAKVIENMRPKENGYSQDIQIRRRIQDPENIHCAENPGDTFLYSQSDVSRKIQVTEDLTVEEIEENVIVATHRFPWAGNCLAVRVSPSELVLVDTPWEGTKFSSPSTSRSMVRISPSDCWRRKGVLERFPEARIVIPGHGAWGDTRLIRHTIDIANQSLRQSGFPVLKGPYLGQKPPGMTPELFAPGIISTKNHNESLFCAYMDGDGLFLFTRSSPGTSGQIYYPIYIMELKDGEWTHPYPATFHNKPCDKNLSIIPDDKTLYFGSRRSMDGRGESSKGFNIWIVKRTAKGFSNPKMLDPPVNSDDYDICPSVSKDGTIYFFSEREGGFGRADIYRSRLVDGKYTGVENIGEPVNTTNSEIDPFIAPDESYLIYCSKTLDGYGGHDLYITFRKKDGSWTEPVNMGRGINSSSYDWIPYVTSDGKYFFFTSDRAGDYDIYWVDAKIIEDLKPKELNTVN